MFATRIQRWGYKGILKPIFFRQDPEDVHDRMIKSGSFLGKSSAMKRIAAFFFRYEDKCLEQNIKGVIFKNPIGLAAGFDKNAELTQILPSVGFGFEEVGSITGEFCEGNPKPRLWRHPELESLRVYYGLKNDGSEAISKRLVEIRFEYPIGISIAKTNCKETVDTEKAIADYVKSYKAFSEIGSYDTINISCPNAYGGQPFVDPERLEKLLVALNQHRNSKPMFIKLSPDLSKEELHALADVAKRQRVDGLICSNLKKNHDKGQGGLSGKQVAPLAMTHLEYLYKTFPNDFVLISCGGVFSGEDAYERICRGASLIQLATGMIYKGPQVIGEINRDLSILLKKNGFNTIADAIGSAYK